jgi:mRNA-degrading endonuclease YafQ of YafQ-DinJ toxin-antitoxin module
MHKASLLFVLDHLLTPTSHTVQKADEMMSHALSGSWQNVKGCHLASYKVCIKVSGICRHHVHTHTHTHKHTCHKGIAVLYVTSYTNKIHRYLGVGLLSMCMCQLTS